MRERERQRKRETEIEREKERERETIRLLKRLSQASLSPNPAFESE